MTKIAEHDATAPSMSKEELEKMKSRAALFSLIAAVFLTSFKLGVGIYTNSLAILSEALHSGLDLVAALMTWYAIRVSSRPADRDHPYGHGKIENLSALGETVLLFIVCGYVGYEGVHRLLEGSSPVVPSLAAVIVMVVSMIVDIDRVRVLRKVAKASNSQALEADALHFSTDILSSAVVFIGVFMVWIADFFKLSEPMQKLVSQLDTIAALIVAIIIFKVTLTMARRAIDSLMDGGLESAERGIEQAVLAIAGVNTLSRLRMRSAGPNYFVDLCIGVDPQLRVSEGHRIAHEVEATVRSLLPQADVTVHVDPRISGVHIDEMTPFALVQRCALRNGIKIHDVHVFTQDDGKAYVEAVVESESKVSFKHAYERCKLFEATIKRQNKDINIITHIEPEENVSSSQVLDLETNPLANLTWQRVQACVEKEPLVSNAHNCLMHTDAQFGVSLSFHCAMASILSVREVHDITIRMEKQLREDVPSLGRIVIHVEPLVLGQEEGLCSEEQALIEAEQMLAHQEPLQEAATTPKTHA